MHFESYIRYNWEQHLLLVPISWSWNQNYLYVLVTVEGKVYACGEATNGRLGLGLSSGTVPIPRQITALSNYVVKKVAVHSGTNIFFYVWQSISEMELSLQCLLIFNPLHISGDGLWQMLWKLQLHTHQAGLFSVILSTRKCAHTRGMKV